jgi:hypothetical protein
MSDEKKSLYDRLGGYDAIVAVANDLLPRLNTDPQLGRFWAHRGEDGVNREKQLLIDFLCASAGGPVYYRGRDMALTHRGMRISESDWNVFRSRGRDLGEVPGPRGRAARGGRACPESQEGDRRIARPGVSMRAIGNTLTGLVALSSAASSSPAYSVE